MGKKTEGRIYRSQWSMIWRRFRKNKLAMAGMVVFILLVLVAIFADIIADYDTMVVRQNMRNVFCHPIRNTGLARMITEGIYLHE